MGHYLALALVILVVLMSGCTQTGSIINKSAGAGGAQASPAAGGAAQPSITQADFFASPAEVNASAGQQQGGTPTGAAPYSAADPCAGVVCPVSVTRCPDGSIESCENTCKGGSCLLCVPECTATDPCEGVFCGDSAMTCPDGAAATCGNTCRNGACTSCMPDCSGHAATPQTESPQCSPQCGACSVPDTATCACVPVTPCCGNGACENATETHVTCPADCAAPEAPENETGTTENQSTTNININMVEPDEEWVKITNTGSVPVNMSKWTLNDTLSSPKIVFVFPSFLLQPYASVVVMKGYGESNTTHMYRNNSNNMWNNDGDAAVLIDKNKAIISTYSYGKCSY